MLKNVAIFTNFGTLSPIKQINEFGVILKMLSIANLLTIESIRIEVGSGENYGY